MIYLHYLHSHETIALIIKALFHEFGGILGSVNGLGSRDPDSVETG